MNSLRQICSVAIGFIFLLSNSHAQTSTQSLVKADKFYNSGNFYLAEENYRKAREREKELKSTFNLGNAVYQQKRYAEAIDHFTAAAQLAPDNTKRSDAYYNLGNALFQNAQEEQAMEPLEESIDAYKEAIQLNPSNQEAKYNLLVAKKVLRSAKEQEQQQQSQNQEQQDQENQENQDQENQEQQEGQENQENQDQENQENQDQQQEEQDSTNQNQDIQENTAFDTTRLDKQTLDSLDAMKLLQVIENEEKKVQEKLKKFNSNRKKPDKDW